MSTGTVLLAEPRGYCAGVDRAVVDGVNELALKELPKGGKVPYWQVRDLILVGDSVAMVVLGGMGHIPGVILGAVLL